jgi:hypothetical protein
MRFLGKAAEAEKSAEVLRGLMPGGRKAKARPTAAAPEPQIAPEPEATEGA